MCRPVPGRTGGTGSTSHNGFVKWRAAQPGSRQEVGEWSWFTLLRELYANPSLGFLSAHASVYWRGAMVIQYWRSFDIWSPTRSRVTRDTSSGYP